MGIVLRPAPDKVDCLATGCAILHVLTAVKEAALVLLGPNVLQLGDQGLAGTALVCLGDVDEERLIRRAGEGAKYVEEVVSTGRTGCNDALGEL